MKQSLVVSSFLSFLCQLGSKILINTWILIKDNESDCLLQNLLVDKEDGLSKRGF